MITRFQIITIISLTVLAGAVGSLYLLLMKSIAEPTEVTTSSAQVAISPTQNSLVDEDQTRLSEMQASIAAMMTRLESLEHPTKKPVSGSVNTPGKPTSSVRREDIYLGSATTTNREWTDTGVEVLINTNDYPANTAAVYEAGLSISGGVAWSRLKNKTTGAIINISEVSHGEDVLAWKSSPTFKLQPGENRYTIELRTTSGEKAILSGARLILSW